MENEICLKGRLWGIQDAHKIGDVQYQKANLSVKNSNGRESVLSLQFKQFQCPYEENQEIQLVGNIRSYSQKISENKNKVNIYVYTYFDLPPKNFSASDSDNLFVVSGRICKIEPPRTFENGKNNIHFILSNRIETQTTTLNSYLPCIAWGNIAKRISALSKNDKIMIAGELRSREYKKQLSQNEFEIRVAHELVVTDFEVLNEEQI